MYDVYGVLVSWQNDGMWYDFEVQTSTDKHSWESRCKEIASGQTQMPSRFAASVTARYLRIVVTGVSGGVPAGIYHVEVFASEAQPERSSAEAKG